MHRLAMVDRMVRRVMVGRMDRRVMAAGTAHPVAAGTVRPAAADTLPEVEVVIPVVVAAAVTPAVVAAIPVVDITKARDGDNNVRKTGKLM